MNGIHEFSLPLGKIFLLFIFFGFLDTLAARKSFVCALEFIRLIFFEKQSLEISFEMHEQADLVELCTIPYTARTFSLIQPRTNRSKLLRQPAGCFSLCTLRLASARAVPEFAEVLAAFGNS